jgi:hypothetical protein
MYSVGCYQTTQHMISSGVPCKSIWVGSGLIRFNVVHKILIPIVDVNMVGPLKYVFDCRGVLTV